MKKKKFCTIIGARPQFIKAALISKELRKNHREILIHTGQHYDYQMSQVFFKEFGMLKPDHDLGVGSGSHGHQTGMILQKTEDVLMREKPDMVIVYGDTNSTLAGALAAAKRGIPVAHIEAGLRSYDQNMPEEINRVATDRISALLFCPTRTAVNNLKKEGITSGVHLVGDVMYDISMIYRKIADKRSNILKKLRITPKKYLLLTIHRASNTDDLGNLKNIIEAIASSGNKVIFPIHPRTKKALKKIKFPRHIQSSIKKNIMIIEPLGYLDMLKLENNAMKVLTDSGGVQKEAYFLGVPCITLRKGTEWIETLKDRANILVGTNKRKILKAIGLKQAVNTSNKYFGNGKAYKKIVSLLTRG
jgi:UDP-N-acetylglucosamine 2-epimerase